ncbi:MAG: hypothetical protein HOO99_06570 [Hyphomicrobiaceae bacterium]|nr:hypothetical protein [Hyphomicrobiaceae bacterium]
MTLIVFVCRGNTCRSPMAEAYAQSAVLERGFSDLRFESAGIALSGQHSTMTPLAKETLVNQGISPSLHVARMLTSALCQTAALLVTLDHAVDRETRAKTSVDNAKVRTLMSFAPTMCDEVVDPWGGSAADYARALIVIRAGVDGLLDALQRSGNVASMP